MTIDQYVTLTAGLSAEATDRLQLVRALCSEIRRRSIDVAS